MLIKQKISKLNKEEQYPSILTSNLKITKWTLCFRKMYPPELLIGRICITHHFRIRTADRSFRGDCPQAVHAESLVEPTQNYHRVVGSNLVLRVDLNLRTINLLYQLATIKST